MPHRNLSRSRVTIQLLLRSRRVAGGRRASPVSWPNGTWAIRTALLNFLPVIVPCSDRYSERACLFDGIRGECIHVEKHYFAVGRNRQQFSETFQDQRLAAVSNTRFARSQK